jgi:hypothetical protein
VCGSTDTDSDGFFDNCDNCSVKANPAQDDTDGDDCGNICDADYTQDGLTSLADFGGFIGASFTFDLQKDHTEPVTGPVALADFGAFIGMAFTPPGPSGTTAGTTACP